MEEIQDINLHIDGQVFAVKKNNICEHSDYFRAMFSGNYIEKEQRDITIDVIDANSMNIILKYMDLRSIDLAEYTVPVICNLIVAANFLQITELLKQIEDCLNGQLTLSNCMKTMAVAEQSSNPKLENLSAAFGLLSFKSMKPEYIPSIDRLCWYLSHPYLDTDNEIDVFKFGFDWISHTETGGDALLIILGCLDVKRLTSDDIKQISHLIKDFKNSLAEKVITCLEWLRNTDSISLETIAMKRSILCEIFTERVYTETYNIVKESKERMLRHTLVAPGTRDKSSNFIYTYTESKGAEKWIEMPVRNLWGCRVAAWGNTKLVVVCGVYREQPIVNNDGVIVSRAVGSYNKDVIIYDTLRKEWTHHGVELPPRRHAGVAVLDDSLYIVGGLRDWPPPLDIAIMYNLKERSYKEIANLPEAMGSPAVCSHQGSIYVARYIRQLYVYEESEERGCWTPVQYRKPYNNDIVGCLLSFNDYIYSLIGHKFVQRLRPGIDKKWERISLFRYPAVMCSLKTHVLVFKSLKPRRTKRKLIQFSEDSKVQTIYDPQMILYDLAGSSLLVVDLPTSLRMELSKYHHQYLTSYSNVYYNNKRSDE